MDRISLIWSPCSGSVQSLAAVCSSASAGRAAEFLIAATSPAYGTELEEESNAAASNKRIYWVAPAMLTIVLASVGLVNSAMLHASYWGWRRIIVGMVILAALTGIPNAIAAFRLAQNQRGAAVVSEALNSNTLNLFAGVCLPPLLLGTPVPEQ
ncbi:MAG: hypothetical protein ABJB66_00145 [Gemmatimonadaceae bacterium]